MGGTADDHGSDGPDGPRSVDDRAGAVGSGPSDRPVPTGAPTDGAPDPAAVVVSDSRVLAEALAGLLTRAGMPAHGTDPAGASFEEGRVTAVLVDASDSEAARAVLEHVATRAPGARRYLLVPGDDDRYGELDAHGAISRGAAPKELVALIREGRVPRDVPDVSPPTVGDDPLRALTDRQREVLRHLAGGASGPEVAVRLGISEHTVRTHVQHILERLDVSSRLEAVTVGVRSGLTNGRGPS